MNSIKTTSIVFAFVMLGTSMKSPGLTTLSDIRYGLRAAGIVGTDKHYLVAKTDQEGECIVFSAQGCHVTIDPSHADVSIAATTDKTITYKIPTSSSYVATVDASIENTDKRFVFTED